MEADLAAVDHACGSGGPEATNLVEQVRVEMEWWLILTFPLTRPTS